MGKEKTIRVCTGIGMNMFFPDYVEIKIPASNGVFEEMRMIFPANVEGSEEFNGTNKKVKRKKTKTNE
jgi:hypothetical protein